MLEGQVTPKLKSLQIELVQEKIDPSQYAEKASSVIVFILQHAAGKT